MNIGKFKDFIFESKNNDIQTFVLMDDIVREALARYCERCKTGFRNPQGKASHVAIRHKKYGK